MAFTGLLWVYSALLWVQCVLLCVACRAMMGMGNRLWDRMTMVGVAGDDWVTCTGHRRHDMLGERDTWVNTWKCKSAQECSGWCEPLSRWGMHTTTRNRRTDGPLASTMLSKPVAPWLSDRAQILDGREWTLLWILPQHTLIWSQMSCINLPNLSCQKSFSNLS